MSSDVRRLRSTACAFSNVNLLRFSQQVRVCARAATEEAQKKDVRKGLQRQKSLARLHVDIGCLSILLAGLGSSILFDWFGFLRTSDVSEAEVSA